MLSEVDTYLLDLQGFLVVPNALSPFQVAELNAIAHRTFADETGTRSRIDDLLRLDPYFWALLDNSAVKPALQLLLDKQYRLDHTYLVEQRPGDTALRLHGGATPFDPAQFYLFNQKPHSGLVAVSFALTDVPDGLGGFACIPGSHKANYECPESIRSHRISPGCVIQVPVRAGDAIVFTEALTHGSLPWLGLHDRRTVFYKYAPACVAWENPLNGPTEGHQALKFPHVFDSESQSRKAVSTVLR